jgi:hypothetical protein
VYEPVEASGRAGLSGFHPILATSLATSLADLASLARSAANGGI